MFRLLRSFDDRGLVKVPLVVDVELAEGILKAKYLCLLELRILPVQMDCQLLWNPQAAHGSIGNKPLDLDDVHGGWVNGGARSGVRYREEVSFFWEAECGEE
jgi:hypothetical protein